METRVQPSDSNLDLGAARLGFSGELRATLLRYEDAARHAGVAVWDVDFVNRRVWLSEGWATMLDDVPRPMTLEFNAMFDFVHPEDQAATRTAMLAALRGEVSRYRAEHRVRRVDGSWVWVKSEGAIVARDPSGRALRALGANTDITPLKRALAALRDSEMQLRTVTDNLPGMVMRCDTARRVRYANRRYAEFFGWAVEDLPGRSVEEVLGRASYQEVLPRVEGVLRGEAQHYERDTGRGWLEVILVPEFDGGGQIVGWYSLSFDITARKGSELALTHTYRMLDAIARVQNQFIELASTQEILRGLVVETLGLSGAAYAWIGLTARHPGEGIAIWTAAAPGLAAQPLATIGATWGTSYKPLPGSPLERALDATGPIRVAAGSSSPGGVGLPEPEPALADWCIVPLRHGQVVGVLLTGGAHGAKPEAPCAGLELFFDACATVLAAVRLREEAEQFKERLLASEGRLRDFSTAASDWLWEMDEALRFTYFSDRFEAVTGVSRKLLLGKERGSAANMVPGDPKWQEHVRRLALRQPFRDFEYALRRPDGNLVYVTVSGIPRFDEQGRFRGYRGTGADISARVKAQRRAMSAAQILERTIANLPIGVSVTDADWNMIAFNQTFLEVLDFPAGRFREGDPLEDFLRFNAQRGEYGPGDADAQVAERMRLARRAEAHCFERQRPDGTVIEVRGLPVAGGGFVTLYTDVTARRRVEEDMRLARAHAEQTARAKSEFLAMMSHEIRTPMNGILGLAALLLEGRLNPEQRDMLETLHRSGESLLAILNDVLDLSKIEAGRLTMESVALSPIRVLQDVAALWRSRAAERGLAIELKYADDLPRGILGDPTRIRQVLENFVANACKFSTEGTIELQLEALDQGERLLRFAVRDGGIGVPTEARDRLFQPFTQADASTTRRFGGTGLGLAICKRLAEMMGGGVGYAPREPAGSVFWFTVPLFEASVPVGTEAAERVQALGRWSGRVLLAEDNEINRRVAKATLQRVGLEVVVAEDGLAALAASERERFDLVLMDLDMPKLDGLGATRAIRAREGGQRTPIVAITANVMEEARRACMGAGMDGFIAKPFKRDELHMELGKWLRPDDSAGAAKADIAIESWPAAAELDHHRLAELREALGEDFAELVEEFLASAAEALPSIARARAAGERGEVRRIAHSLKSAAANLGAGDLAGRARELETVASRPEGGLDELVASLAAAFERSRLALEKLER